MKNTKAGSNLTTVLLRASMFLHSSQLWALNPKSSWFEIKVTIQIVVILLMDKILHDPKDPKLWELWYIP